MKHKKIWVDIMLEKYMDIAHNSCWAFWASEKAILEHILHCIYVCEKRANETN